MVIKEDVELVEKSLENRIRELYTDVIFSEHNLYKLFKASLVSIPDDKLNSTQIEKYFKKTFEEGILNWFKPINQIIETETSFIDSFYWQ